MAIWEALSQKGKEILDEEILLESRSFRDSYSTEENLSILELVGLLATLPDTAWSTVEQRAMRPGGRGKEVVPVAAPEVFVLRGWFRVIDVWRRERCIVQ